ncbi:methionyl-tRNA formyltransferase [Jannaschia sp. LMIT008]|uniref:methionyl-tRNA formyltransferase n=1 Tax=Jannaschia maritima TaxID=3032585 RepID=UPI0028113858|nr:methionyl-tRNA formyltransferase [Jannaschia sp. LMIT008]
MRVIFMGTPDFAVPVLRAVAGAHEVVCAYTQPPRPAGRGKRDRPSPVEVAAEGLGIPVRSPASLKGSEIQAGLARLDADVAVVVAYGLLLPTPVLDAPRQGCLNVHASLLPRWRGAAPIHRAVMAGDGETGVCVMRMEAGLDTGPVLLRRAVPIGPTDTTGDLHDRLSALGAGAMVEVLDRLPDVVADPQPEDGVTYAAKIDKAEAAVDWSRPAAAVARQVNGLSPFPGAFVLRDGARLKLLRARAVDGTGAAGTVLGEGGLVVAAGDGAVEVLEVQPAGRGPMPAAVWRRGARLGDGDALT